MDGVEDVLLELVAGAVELVFVDVVVVVVEVLLF